MNLENIKTKLSSTKIQLFLIVIVAAITWSTSLTTEFTGYDDIKLIVDNEVIASDFSRILQFFWNSFSSSFNTAWTNQQTIIHRPLEQYGSAIGYKLWGASAWHFHFFFNYLLHIINSILLFFIIKKLSNNQMLSFVSVLIWTVHPLHNEAINMLTSGVGFLFAHFFSFIAIYLNLLKTEGKLLILCLLGSFICLFLGYMGSEMTVIAPLVLILILFSSEHKHRLVKVITALVSLLLYFWHRSSIGCSQGDLFDNDFLERTFVLAPQILFHHIKLFFFPIKLSIDEQHRMILENAFSPFHLACLALSFALIYALFHFHQEKMISGALFIAGLSISLSLNVIPVYCLARNRYTYIFSLALIIALVFYLSRHLKKNQIVLVSILVLILGTRSWVKSLDWANGEKLWTHTIDSIDDIGAKQVWRYQLLQYYLNPTNKSFKANKAIQDKIFEDFNNFIHANKLEQKETINNYRKANPSSYLKDKYSYNSRKSIASGILSKAMYLKQYGPKENLLDHLNLAYVYDPHNIQTELQLYIHVKEEEYKQGFLQELSVEASQNPYSAKLLLSLLHNQNSPVFYQLSQKYAELYPRVQIIQAYYFDAALKTQKYEEAYKVATCLSKKYHEDPRYDEFIGNYESLLLSQ
ncbi:MAG: hypothetical protein HOA17_09325 [Candidatus Melainabacteria bacterium]|jgi:hypothetical protein|nr:hypothetical protein [Candidatus Melainabacteria bacterium]